ncbi:restriction endonuclease subunit S [Stenotrophomonas indicatrix]|uniref:restriction endonuclease subunit S n=1 Tax=Stenotrophomonas indicatrix TaxID=2045451 RepID=UPI00215B65FB|nr:restriction endonuclease subunit S [Stenotrophomonas indicatrix]MCR8716808.1 restriction endonuclease subunit S [Stenotrophomonas indicatrix]
MSFYGYPTYKDSGSEWIGAIPDHWSASALKRLFRIEGGSTPKSDEVNWDGDIAWVTPADLSGLSSFFLGATKRTITSQGLASCGTTLLPVGSLILSTRAPIGSLAISLVSMCTNQGCKGLVPNASAYSTYFAYVLLAAKNELNNRGRGATFLEISGDELGRFSVPTPPFEEQVQIARFLDHEIARIDALIEEQQRLIGLLKEKRQAVVSNVVTKGIDTTAPMKKSDVEWLGDVPAHWDVTKLGWVLNELTYGFTNPMPTEDWGPAMLTANDIGWGVVLYDQARSTSEIAFRELLTDKSRPRAGDLLLTKDGTLGRVAVHDGRAACINQSVALLRPDYRFLDSEFLCGVIQASCYQAKMLFDAGGTTIKHIYITVLAKMSVAIPPLHEQQVLLHYMNSETGRLDGLSSEACQVVALLQERRSALISAAVTGEIDVRGWQPPVSAPATELLEEVV